MITENREKHMRRMLTHGEQQQKRQTRQAAEFEQGCKAMWGLLQWADLSQVRPKISRRIP